MRPSNNEVTRPSSSEAILISSLLNTSSVEVAASLGITPDMFAGYQSEYLWILSYRARYGEDPSPEALKHKFPGFPHSDVEEIRYAADEVKNDHLRRKMVAAIKIAADQLNEGDIEEAYLALTSFTPPTAISIPMTNALLDERFLESYNEPIDALPVPWKTLQALTGGIRGGDLWYMAARLSQGKSWNCGVMARDLLLDPHKYRVGFYSLEMSELQVQVRMHVLLGASLGIKVDHKKMRDRQFDIDEYRKLVRAIREQVPGELYVFDQAKGKISPATLSSQVDQYDVVIVDYIGLMASATGGRAIDDWRAMATISNMLKEIAQAKNVPIIAAAQINREGDNNDWRPPKTKNLSQSDALGQDADVVITHKQYSRTTQIMGLDKNRHGEAQRYWWTKFQPNDGIFDEITRDRADDIRSNEDDE